jgi:urease accessory protein
MEEAQVAVRRLPAAFANYEEAPVQMAAGAPGKLGLLQLEFVGGDGDPTRLLPHYASGPPRLQRALYLDPAQPNMAFGIMQSVSGGILQGDRLAVEITAGPGSQAHVTTQSATKLYRMERNYATQRVWLRALSGAYLEFLPDYLIPYRGARFYQELELEVADDATVLLSDSFAPGRVASGELFAYELLWTRVRAGDLEGRLRFSDTTRLQPARHAPGRVGMLGTHRDLATLYVVTRQVDAGELEAALYECVAAAPDVWSGVSRLPDGAGVVVRVMGPHSRAVQTALYGAWRVTRRLLLGTEAPALQALKYGFEPSTTFDPP